MLETQVEKPPAIVESRCVLVCQHQSCQRQNAARVLEAFQAMQIPGVRVEASGCLGQCSSGPTVRITPDEIWYCRVKPSDVPQVVEQHLLGGKPVDAMLNPRIHLKFYSSNS